MPWDNRVNKKTHIHAIAATVLVEQFPVTESVEWATLMASLPLIGIYRENPNTSGMMPAPKVNTPILYIAFA